MYMHFIYQTLNKAVMDVQCSFNKWEVIHKGGPKVKTVYSSREVFFSNKCEKIIKLKKEVKCLVLI